VCETLLEKNPARDIAAVGFFFWRTFLNFLLLLDNWTMNDPASNPGVTLVKSARGISRAPAVWIAYLVKMEGLTLKEAFEEVKRCHPQTRLNAGFFEQLMALEREVTRGDGNTMQLADYRKTALRKWF